MILKLSLRLYKAQHGNCFHCGLPMEPNPARKRNNGSYTKGWTREHVIPKAHGGKNKNNVVLAHTTCNGKRGMNTLSKKNQARALAIIKEANEYHFKKDQPDGLGTNTKSAD